MDITKHEHFFSKIRISRYLNACGGDVYKAVNLYKYNLQASQALYPCISVLEVALRNALDREMSGHFKDPTWLITQRTKFATHVDMVYTDRHGMVKPDTFFSEKLKKAEDKLTFRKAPITHGKLLAELTFGFWAKFFDKSAIKVISGAPLQAFKHRPSMKATAVHSHINNVVVLRNRISHSEPICFDKSGNLCLATISGYENNILQAIGWIDADLKAWTEKMNFFKPVYNRMKNL